ncbi:hypothetical protein [Streptomyces katrae]|uniref:hypothetical protein n=1 Tax=Streptomyces katrae TaxID=68223 RepID=UPI00131D1A92|nr:hypothetical protein [Streptomyces katrae]
MFEAFAAIQVRPGRKGNETPDPKRLILILNQSPRENFRAVYFTDVRAGAFANAPALYGLLVKQRQAATEGGKPAHGAVYRVFGNGPGGPVTPTSPIRTPIIEKYVLGLAAATDRTSPIGRHLT